MHGNKVKLLISEYYFKPKVNQFRKEITAIFSSLKQHIKSLSATHISDVISTFKAVAIFIGDFKHLWLSDSVNVVPPLKEILQSLLNGANTISLSNLSGGLCELYHISKVLICSTLTILSDTVCTKSLPIEASNFLSTMVHMSLTVLYSINKKSSNEKKLFTVFCETILPPLLSYLNFSPDDLCLSALEHEQLESTITQIIQQIVFIDVKHMEQLSTLTLDNCSLPQLVPDFNCSIMPSEDSKDHQDFHTGDDVSISTSRFNSNYLLSFYRALSNSLQNFNGSHFVVIYHTFVSTSNSFAVRTPFNNSRSDHFMHSHDQNESANLKPDTEQDTTSYHRLKHMERSLQFLFQLLKLCKLYQTSSSMELPIVNASGRECLDSANVIKVYLTLLKQFQMEFPLSIPQHSILDRFQIQFQKLACHSITHLIEVLHSINELEEKQYKRATRNQTISDIGTTFLSNELQPDSRSSSQTETEIKSLYTVINSELESVIILIAIDHRTVLNLTGSHSITKLTHKRTQKAPYNEEAPDRKINLMYQLMELLVNRTPHIDDSCLKADVVMEQKLSFYNTCQLLLCSIIDTLSKLNRYSDLVKYIIRSYIPLKPLIMEESNSTESAKYPSRQSILSSALVQHHLIVAFSGLQTVQYQTLWNVLHDLMYYHASNSKLKTSLSIETVTLAKTSDDILTSTQVAEIVEKAKFKPVINPAVGPLFTSMTLAMLELISQVALPIETIFRVLERILQSTVELNHDLDAVLLKNELVICICHFLTSSLVQATSSELGSKVTKSSFTETREITEDEASISVMSASAALLWLDASKRLGDYSTQLVDQIFHVATTSIEARKQETVEVEPNILGKILLSCRCCVISICTFLMNVVSSGIIDTRNSYRQKIQEFQTVVQLDSVVYKIVKTLVNDIDHEICHGRHIDVHLCQQYAVFLLRCIPHFGTSLSANDSAIFRQLPRVLHGALFCDQTFTTELDYQTNAQNDFIRSQSGKYKHYHHYVGSHTTSAITLDSKIGAGCSSCRVQILDMLNQVSCVDSPIISNAIIQTSSFLLQTANVSLTGNLQLSLHSDRHVVLLISLFKHLPINKVLSVLMSAKQVPNRFLYALVDTFNTLFIQTAAQQNSWLLLGALADILRHYIVLNANRYQFLLKTFSTELVTDLWKHFRVIFSGILNKFGLYLRFLLHHAEDTAQQKSIYCLLETTVSTLFLTHTVVLLCMEPSEVNISNAEGKPTTSKSEEIRQETTVASTNHSAIVVAILIELRSLFECGPTISQRTCSQSITCKLIVVRSLIHRIVSSAMTWDSADENWLTLNRSTIWIDNLNSLIESLLQIRNIVTFQISLNLDNMQNEGAFAELLFIHGDMYSLQLKLYELTRLLNHSNNQYLVNTNHFTEVSTPGNLPIFDSSIIATLKSISCYFESCAADDKSSYANSRTVNHIFTGWLHCFNAILAPLEFIDYSIISPTVLLSLLKYIGSFLQLFDDNCSEATRWQIDEKFHVEKIVSITFTRIFCLLPQMAWPMILNFCNDLIPSQELNFNAFSLIALQAYVTKLCDDSTEQMSSDKYSTLISVLNKYVEYHISSTECQAGLKRSSLESKFSKSISSMLSIIVSILASIDVKLKQCSILFKKNKRQRNIDNSDLVKMNDILSTTISATFNILTRLIGQFKLLLSTDKLSPKCMTTNTILEILKLLEMLLNRPMPWYGNSVASITCLCSSLLSICLPNTHCFAMTTNSSSLRSNHNATKNITNEFTVPINVIHYYSRVLKNIANNEEFSRHIQFIFVYMIDFVSKVSISDNSVLQALHPGLFALLDKCRQKQRKQIYELLRNQSRFVYDELYAIYLRDYKFGTNHD